MEKEKGQWGEGKGGEEANPLKNSTNPQQMGVFKLKIHILQTKVEGTF